MTFKCSNRIYFYVPDCVPFLLSEVMRGYLQQLRQETGLRLCEKVFDPQSDKPSKVRGSSCFCFCIFSSLNNSRLLFKEKNRKIVEILGTFQDCINLKIVYSEFSHRKRASGLENGFKGLLWFLMTAAFLLFIFSCSLLVVDLFCEKAVHEQKPVRTRAVKTTVRSVVTAFSVPRVI